MKKKKIDKISKDIPTSNTELLDMSRIAIGGSQTTSNNDNVSGYPVKVTLFVRRDGLNTYYIKSTVTTRWGNYNAYGMVSKVCSETGASSASEWVRATKKPFNEGNTLVAEKTVNVTYSGTFYGVARCMHCEYGSPHSAKFAQITPGISYTYENPTITPGKPTTGRPSNAKFNDGTYDVYAGGDIAITNSGGSNVSSRKIDLECYYPSSGWATWTPNGGFNSWAGSGETIAGSFSGTGNNRGYIYRVTCHTRSSTGHTASDTTYYFKVNDFPSISGFTTSHSETSGAFTLSHSGISDGFNNGLKTRYYRKSGGKWVHIGDAGNSYDLNITNYANVGESIEFSVQPYDGLEWGDMRAGVYVKRTQVYSKPSLLMEAASNNSTFNYQGVKTYAGDQNIYFAVANHGNYDKCSIRLGYYDHRDGNKWVYWEPTGFNSWADYPNPHHYFSTANNDRGFKWGAQPQVKSASGHITSGDWTYFWINDLPVANNFRSNTNRTRDSVTISWDSKIDTINQGDITYQIANYKNGTHHLLAESNGGSSKTISLLSAGASRGEVLTLKMRVKDALEYGQWSSGSVTVTMNSDPYFDSNAVITSDRDSSQYNKYFDDYINFTFPIIRDVDTTSGSQYRIEYSIHNGSGWSSWTHLANRSSSSFNHSFASIVPRGQNLRLQVSPVDDLGAIGVGKISETYTRVSAPSVPTNIALNSSKYRNNHYETLESVTWSPSHSSSGDIVEYKCILQVISSNGSVARESTHLSSTTNAKPPLTFVNRGESFRVRVLAKDVFGNWSNPAQTETKTRNNIPNRVSNFKAIGSKANYFNEVPLTWNAASDPDNDTVRYEIHHRTELGSWRVVADNVRANSYTHSIAGYAPGTKLGYKIVPIDQLDAKGTETILENSDNITVNIPPLACVPLAPFDDPVYAKRPRLLIEKVVSDSNKDDIILEVVLNGNTYTSSANPELFNKRIFSKTEAAAFVPPFDLTPGSHLVKFRTFDGLQYSPYVQETIEVKAMLESTKTSRVDYITAASVNKCCQMIEANSKAYKKATSETQTQQGKIITATEVNGIYKKAYDLAKYITSLANGLGDSHTSINLSRNEKIDTDWFNKMISIIERP